MEDKKKSYRRSITQGFRSVLKNTNNLLNRIRPNKSANNKVKVNKLSPKSSSNKSAKNKVNPSPKSSSKKSAKYNVNVNNLSQNSASYKTAESGSIEFKNAEDIPENILPRLNKTAKKNLEKIFAKHTIRESIIKNAKKLKENVRLNYLKTVCSDSHVCIAFGRETEKIIQFFDFFSNFHLLSGPLEKIGKKSANGFVNELTYEKDGYSANAILKSSANVKSDNLLYEGFVGFFLNDIGKQFSCFLETYGVYEYISKKFYNKMRNDNTITQTTVIDNLKLFVDPYKGFDNELIKYACSDKSQYLAVMIQYLKDAKTLSDMCNDTLFIQNHLTEILFQIYMPLAHLINQFTHYDLHSNNVLIYKPVNNGFIEYFYHLENNKIVTFKSPYIAKIIDYGRCFIYSDENTSSLRMKEVVAHVCDNPPYYGFKRLFNPNTTVYNQSSDLFLLYDIINTNYINDDMTNMYKIIKFDYVNNTSTPQLVSDYPKSLKTCHDVFLFLTDVITKSTFIDRNNKEFENNNWRTSYLCRRKRNEFY